MVDTFDREFEFDVRHISVAKEADVILVAPATADIIAKMAHGIADDMLTTVVLAAKCRKLVSPSMNTAMLENPITQDNIALLRKYGFSIIDSASGYLACGDTGSGKLPEPEVLCQWIEREIAYMDKPMKGKKVVVTAGPTQEALDPVRYLTNHSSGKMGYAIAHEAMLRGADVTLISGPVSLPAAPFVRQRNITSAADMFDAIREEIDDTDILIKAAEDQKGPFRPGKSDRRDRGHWHVHSTGPHAGYPGLGCSKPSSRTFCMRFFHGDGEPSGQFLQKAHQEETRYDRCKQPAHSWRRIRCRHQCRHPDHQGRRSGASPYEQRGCRRLYF